MESLYLLIPIGIVFVVIAVKILFWAINSGQYDNLDTEAYRILFDEQEHLKDKSAEDDDAQAEGSEARDPERPAAESPQERPPRE